MKTKILILKGNNNCITRNVKLRQPKKWRRKRYLNTHTHKNNERKLFYKEQI